MTRSRIRRQPDQGRMADLVRSPGIDPRTWVVVARVDDDEDAIRWADADSDDGPLGWLVDCTVQGGPLDQEPLDGCRVASYFSGENTDAIHPIERDCLVIVVMPEGHGDTEPTIVGVMPSAGCEPPADVNGTAIDEDYASMTHILVTDKAVDEQVAGDIRVKTDGTHMVLGADVELAEEGAGEPFVRGNDLESAVNGFAQEVLSAFQDLLPAGPPVTPVTAAQVTLALATVSAAVIQLQADMQTALSTRITGE